MVQLAEVRASNARISSTLSSGLVAVFVGGTSGVGETTLKQFVKYARQPRVYIVGRSKEAGNRITAECGKLNEEGKYVFMQKDVSLIRNVDEICRELKSMEKAINLLFLSTGTLIFGTETSESLHFGASLVTYSRNRFILNLLPLLEQAVGLRRVVSCFAGTKEGPVFADDFQGMNIPMLSSRGHIASLVTLSLEALAKRAPSVAFIHNFPGPVKSGIGRGATDPAMLLMKAIFMVIGPFINMSNLEAGDRHLFLATSARYASSFGMDEDAPSDGVPLVDGLPIAGGSVGMDGSGVYTVDQFGESAGAKVLEILKKLRKEGIIEKFWKHTEDVYGRITGMSMGID